MKKFKLSGSIQGLIIMTLGLISNTTLLVMMLYWFTSEKFAFIVLFAIIEVLILIVINQLIGEYKNEKKNIN